MALHGYVDLVRRGRILGWAWDSERPAEFLTIVVFLNDKEVARGIANRRRDGLADLGFGEDGQCAFVIQWDDSDALPGNYKLSVLVEGSDGQLRDCPDIYHVSGGINIFDSVSFRLNHQKQLSFNQLEPSEMARVAFEVVDGADCFLRIWLVAPNAREASAKQDRVEDAPTDQVLLRYTAISKDLVGLARITAGLDVRAISSEIPLTLRVQGRSAEKVLIDHKYQLTTTGSWAMSEFEVQLPQTREQPDQWLYEISTCSIKLMAGIEIRDLTLGIRKPRIALAPISQSNPSDFYSPPTGQYSESNLLKDTRLTIVSSDGSIALSEKWKAVPGRNGKLEFCLAAYPWLPDGDRRRQPRSLSGFSIEKNDFYFRFTQNVPPSCVSAFKRIGTELLFGADARQATKTGLALQSFFRVIKAAGDETIFKLLPRQEVKPGLIHKYAELEIKEDEVKALTGAKSVEYVIEVTGTGSLILGPCWAGDACLLSGKAQSIASSADRAARDWHYRRYLETTETLFVRAEPGLKLVACVVAYPDLSADLKWRSTAATIRSLIKHTSQIRLIVDSTEEHAEISLSALRKTLSQIVSLPDMSKISIKAARDDLAKADLFRSLVEALEPRTFVMSLRSGCVVRSDLLDAIASATSEKEGTSIIVFDHDNIDNAGRRSTPVMMPGISGHLLLESDYIGCAVAVRADVLKQVLASGGRSPTLRFGWRDVLLRLFDQGIAGTKLDHVLLHCDTAKEPLDLASERAFIESVLARRGTQAVIARWGSEHIVKYRTSPQPLVSIIIPFHDKADLLRRCIDSILTQTCYENFELILVDNRSVLPETLDYLVSIRGKNPNIRVIQYDMPFNYSAANNVGVAHAKGDFLVFMNNDTEVVSPDWLADMVGLAALDDTGFVGARLHFGDGTIQHAGVVIGLRGLANHVLAGEHDLAMPRFMTMHTRDVSAVTAAVACIKADRFRSIGGFNERFVLTGNDVEICLRAKRSGLRNVYAGAVQLFHFEKSTRKDIPVYPRDIQMSLETYEPELSMGDPYWNSALSRVRTDYLPRAPVEPTTGDERQAAADKRLREMQSRNLGTDTTFIARSDVDRATISSNRALNALYASGVSGTVHSAAFFVPPLTHIYRGGLYTCFRFAAALFHEKQVRPLIVICSESAPDFDLLEKQFREAFPGVPFSFYHFNAVRDSPVVIPAADIAVATLWTTAYVVARYNAKGKFYLIQDYEPLFEAAGAGYGLIEASYRFGFFPICNSPGVAAAVAPYSDGPILTFEPAVDQTVFLPTDFPRADSPTRIVFYGRPHNPRNLFGLGMHALLEVKSILADSVEILSVGANFNPKDHGAGGKIINLGLLPSIDSVAALYRSSDIGLVFMQSKHPSYQPLEYMASGCATVTNVNESNSWLLRHRVNCLLTQITLTDVVDTIIELVRDSDLRRSIQAGGLATVRSMDWSSIERRVVDFMLHPGTSTSMANNRRDAS